MTRRILIVGPPGGGALTAVRSWPMMQPWSPLDRLEASIVHQAAGLVSAFDAWDRQWAAPDHGQLLARPFRAPHHTVSVAGLVGGGDGKPRPGEVSFAHGGTLVLDQISEFRRDALECLFKTIERGEARFDRSVRRAYPGMPMVTSESETMTWVYPARPALVIGIVDAFEKLERVVKLLEWFY